MNTRRPRFASILWALSLIVLPAGTLACFGYPIGGEFALQLENGRTDPVQWFACMRIAFRSEHVGTPLEVLFGQFGRRILAGR